MQIGNHVAAAMESRNLDGAELEYNQAQGLKATGAFPLELLSPAVEERAVTVTNTAVQSRPWLDRLFAETAAMKIGITFESVPAGVANFPVITAGGIPAQRGKGQDAGDAPWTVGVSDLKPTRNAVRAVFSEEDAMRLPGLEEALEAGSGDGLDRKGRPYCVQGRQPRPTRPTVTSPGLRPWPTWSRRKSTKPTRSRGRKP